jgi:hypothetical protein
MNNTFYLAICVAVATLLFGSMGHAQQSMTLGQLIDRGGKKLAKDEVKRLVSGATLEGAQGGNFPTTTFKNVYAPDGTVRGDAWNKGAWFTRINGKWSVNDAGQLCSELRNDQGGNIAGCQTYYAVGNTYYAARGDAPSSEVNERKISR